MNNLITALDLHEHDLPETARLLVSIIGDEAAAALINQLGGTTFPVSKNKSQLGQIRFAILAEVIGEEAASTLTQHFGGEVLFIPRCDDLRRRLRNREIHKEFDLLCKEHTAATAVTLLSIKHRMSDRNVWKLLKKLTD